MVPGRLPRAVPATRAAFAQLFFTGWGGVMERTARRDRPPYPYPWVEAASAGIEPRRPSKVDQLAAWRGAACTCGGLDQPLAERYARGDAAVGHRRRRGTGAG